MKPCPDQPDDTKSCYNAHSGSTSRTKVVAFIVPHLSMPRRGPRCKLGYHRVFDLILWVLSTGMQWKCLPVPRGGDGSVVIHYTTIYGLCG